MKLLSVRLSPEDARMAARLRKDGIQISRVVREAIRAAYEGRTAARSPRRRARAKEVMAEIYRELPDPPGLRCSKRDLSDRATVRRLIGNVAQPSAQLEPAPQPTPGTCPNPIVCPV
jgi:hypothetical protein